MFDNPTILKLQVWVSIWNSLALVVHWGYRFDFVVAPGSSCPKLLTGAEMVDICVPKKDVAEECASEMLKGIALTTSQFSINFTKKVVKWRAGTGARRSSGFLFPIPEPIPTILYFDRHNGPKLSIFGHDWLKSLWSSCDVMIGFHFEFNSHGILIIFTHDRSSHGSGVFYV